MACNAEISTSTEHSIYHNHRNRSRPISHSSIPTPKPRARTHVNRDPTKRNISALMGMGRKEDSGKSKFIGLGGLGCVSSTPVSAPEVIRTAADWEERTKRSKAGKKLVAARVGIYADVCCGPGIGFAADDALVDCVDSRRPVGPRTSHPQRFTAARLPMTFEDADYEAASNSVPEVSGTRQVHRRAHCGLPEIQMLDSVPYPGRRFSVHDRFGGWRLDVDSMSYEELLALGDRIGYVGTGLREEEIHRFIRKIKHSVLESLPLLVSDNGEWSCSICQDGFEAEEEIGKLECNHLYHMHCIKQWLLQKNACPVCKAAAAATRP